MATEERRTGKKRCRENTLLNFPKKSRKVDGASTPHSVSCYRAFIGPSSNRKNSRLREIANQKERVIIGNLRHRDKSPEKCYLIYVSKEIINEECGVDVACHKIEPKRLITSPNQVRETFDCLILSKSLWSLKKTRDCGDYWGYCIGVTETFNRSFVNKSSGKPQTLPSKCMYFVHYLEILNGSSVLLVPIGIKVDPYHDKDNERMPYQIQNAVGDGKVELPLIPCWNESLVPSTIYEQQQQQQQDIAAPPTSMDSLDDYTSNVEQEDENEEFDGLLLSFEETEEDKENDYYSTFFLKQSYSSTTNNEQQQQSTTTTKLNEDNSSLLNDTEDANAIRSLSTDSSVIDLSVDGEDEDINEDEFFSSQMDELEKISYLFKNEKLLSFGFDSMDDENDFLGIE